VPSEKSIIKTESDTNINLVQDYRIVVIQLTIIDLIIKCDHVFKFDIKGDIIS